MSENLTNQLLQNIEENVADSEPAVTAESAEDSAAPAQEAASAKTFLGFNIRDIVFLAVITAATFITSAIMPLLVHVPLFGIIQLGLGLQFSIFPIIGLAKVRKPGSLTFMAVLMACVLSMMFPPMALIAVCAAVIELVVYAVFRGYAKDAACVIATTLYMPSTLPMLYIYYNAFYTVTGDEKEAVSMFLGGSSVGMVAGISVAVVALCLVGSLLGMKIARELKKAGVLK